MIPSRGIFQYHNNLYTDKNFYFIAVGDAGKRMLTTPSITGNFPVVAEFDDLGYYESEKQMTFIPDEIGLVNSLTQKQNTLYDLIFPAFSRIRL